MAIVISDIIVPSGPFPVVDASNMRGGFRAVASSVPGGSTPAVEEQLTGLVGGAANTSQGMLVFDTRTSKFYQLGGSSQWAETSLAESDTYNSQAFNDAVQRELLANLPETDGVLNVAQQSTLVDVADEVTSISGRVTDLETNAPSSLAYLTTFFPDGTLPESPATGYLRYDDNLSQWSFNIGTVDAPAEINGGNAASFQD